LKDQSAGSRRVSIVIPCVDGLDLLAACLATLPLACAEHLREVIVVDNGSSDPGGFDAIPDVRVIHHRTNLGFAGGSNSGIRAARGELVMVLNNDTLCAPGMIDRMVRGLDAQPGAALIAPQSNCVKGLQLLPLGDEGLRAEGRAEISRLLAETSPAKVEDAESLSGLCLLGSAATWRTVGLFDATFPLGNFEDDDLCLRARRLGVRLLIARDAYVHHLGNRTFTLLAVDYGDRLERNRLLLEEKWRDDPLLRAHEAIGKNELELASDFAARARAEFPLCPDVALLRWSIARAMGNAAEAVVHLTSFLAACPFHTPSSLELGFELLALGRVAAGRERLSWTLTHCHLEPAVAARALVRLGEWCVSVGLVVEARGHFESAATLGCPAPRARIGLGVCALAEGRLDAAEDAFRSALDDHDPIAWMNLGVTLWRSGRVAESVDCLERAHAIAPEYRPARENLEQALRAARGSPRAAAGPR
jgi:GT2 family glycosyltransferase